MGPARVPDVLDLLAELFEADEELVGLPRRAAQVAVAHIKEYGCPPTSGTKDTGEREARAAGLDHGSPTSSSARNVLPSQVPNMLAKLMTGAPTVAARKRVVCPTVQADMKPPYE
jgi:hypothetical protein